MIGGICAWLGVSTLQGANKWILQILNLQLVRSHQEEIITIKHFIHEHNNETRVHIESDHMIRVIVKSMPLPFRPCSQLTLCILLNLPTMYFKIYIP